MLTGKRLFALLVFLLTILGGSSVPLAGSSDPKDKESKEEKSSKSADAEDIDKWISQLGAVSFKEREDAIQRLIAIGPSALRALRRVADDKLADPDVRLRAARAAFAIATVKIDMVRRLGEHKGQPNNPNSCWATRGVISPDGKHAVTAGMDAVRYWDLTNNRQIRVFGENRQGYWSVAFSPDGRRIVGAGNNNIVRLFDVNTGKLLHEMKGHAQAIWGVVFSPDGKQVLSGSWDRSIRVWDTETGKQLRTFNGVRDSVRCLALSPDGKLLAASHFAAVNGPGILRLWDLTKGTEVRSMKGHELEITSISFSSDGKSLLTSSFDRTIRVWQVADGKEVKCLRGHSGRIECAVFTPDGRRVVSCADESDPTLRLWDVSSGRQLGETEQVEQGFLGIAPLPDNQHALTTGKDGSVRLWRWER
ncbi:MAG TPA: WD40 repeat domain-containing protein [Gemmataceae bacterium]|jgi:WD40 repeat protein